VTAPMGLCLKTSIKARSSRVYDSKSTDRIIHCTFLLLSLSTEYIIVIHQLLESTLSSMKNIIRGTFIAALCAATVAALAEPVPSSA
jgi:hypothetical protein